MARSALVLALAVFCAACSSGGSSGNNAQPPAPPPVFYTIDAPYDGFSGTRFTIPQGISASGEIAGYGQDFNNLSTAFVQSPSGSLSMFAPPFGYSVYPPPTAPSGGSTALDINASGTVVGSYSTEDILAPNVTSFGFTRTAGASFTRIDFPGSTFTFANAINAQGDVAGTFGDSNQAVHGFLCTSDGIYTSFDLPNGVISSVVRLTDTDGIAGNFIDSSSTSHGFLRLANGSVTQIDAPGAVVGYGTVLNDKNASGVIVGSLLTSSGSHSFSRATDGTFTVFDPSGTGPASSSPGINTAGLIVGDYSDSQFVTHGYIRNLDGTFTILDDPSAGQVHNCGTFPYRINDSGQIIGTYVDAQGAHHGFVRK